MTANPFLHATVGSMLSAVAERFPDREAIVATTRRVDYREFHAQARASARALLALGVRKDDKIALWLPNRPAWPFAQYGCARRRRGGCAQPALPGARARLRSPTSSRAPARRSARRK